LLRIFFLTFAAEYPCPERVEYTDDTDMRVQQFMLTNFAQVIIQKFAANANSNRGSINSCDPISSAAAISQTN
jgi:hypothetical protein